MQNSKSYSNAGQRPDDKISATTTLSIIQTILLAAILILGLSGKFVSGGTGIGTDELKTVVAQVVKENTPTAAAPAAAPTAAKPAAAPTATAPSQADATKLSEFYKTAYIEGNKQASISVIEFSDIECPFCQRHTNNGTLDTVAKKYGDKLSIAFGHFPLGFHPYAQKAGEAVECAGKIGGESVFFSFKKALFAKGGKPTIDVIKATATENNLDATKIEDCIKGGEFAAKVTAQSAFGQTLGVTGTPSNIIINNKTGKFVKIAGAVPATTLEASIDAMLKEAE